jgi:hypothetical protein
MHSLPFILRQAQDERILFCVLKKNKYEEGSTHHMATIGVDCNITLTNAQLNGGMPVGFFVKPGTFTMSRPRLASSRATAANGLSYVETGLGKRAFEFVVLSRSNLRNFDGSMNAVKARDWHDRLWSFYQLLNASHTLVDPLEDSYTVRFAACEDRVLSFGKEQLWVLEWETRIVLQEV